MTVLNVLPLNDIYLCMYGVFDICIYVWNCVVFASVIFNMGLNLSRTSYINIANNFVYVKVVIWDFVIFLVYNNVIYKMLFNAIINYTHLVV
jgi:hypothetical protein